MNPYDKPPLDELVHFGVLGMKWGVRRGSSQSSYEKRKARARSQNESLEKKIVKTETKAAKTYSKVAKAQKKLTATKLWANPDERLLKRAKIALFLLYLNLLFVFIY